MEQTIPIPAKVLTVLRDIRRQQDELGQRAEVMLSTIALASDIADGGAITYNLERGVLIVTPKEPVEPPKEEVKE
jgi:predicted transcriptional regulator